METYLKRVVLLSVSLFISPVNASVLGQITIHDPARGSQTITYEQRGDYALVEDDIIIGTLEQLQRQGAVITTKIGGTRWSHGVIPYELSEELPFQTKLAILQAIEQWQKHTHVEFVELNSKNRYQYRDYLSFIPAAGTTCSSYVGRQGGMQTINLAPRCSTMNVVHEIGHALGMWHEQSRADRNSYVQIVWENIEESYKFNFEQKLNDGKDVGEYDYQSIMHYGPYSFSKNGEKTIIPLVDGAEIGQRDRLSEKDIAAVKAMYPDI